MARRRVQRTIIGAWVGLLVLLGACGARPEPSSQIETGKVRFKIGYLPITHAAPLFMEKYRWDGSRSADLPFELELVKFGSWTDLIDALNAGKIDGASVLAPLAVKAKERGIDLKIVASGHRDGNVVVVSPKIQDAADLKGQTFAVPHKFSSHYILFYAMLKKAGLHAADVSVVEMPPPEMPAALSEGRIAGYAVAEPFGAIAVAKGLGKVLYQSHELWPDSICCVLVLRKDFIDRHREAAVAFVRSYFDGGHAAESKDAKVKSAINTFMSVEEKVLDLSLKWIRYDDLTFSEDAYETLRTYLKETGISEHPPAYADIVDEALIKAAVAEKAP